MVVALLITDQPSTPGEPVSMQSFAKTPHKLNILVLLPPHVLKFLVFGKMLLTSR